MDALVQAHRVLLQDNLLLHQRVDLLLEEVALVDVVALKLLEVFLEVGDVLDNLLQDVISCLGGVMLESCALRAQKLDFFFVIVEQLYCFFGRSLFSKQESWYQHHQKVTSRGRKTKIKKEWQTFPLLPLIFAKRLTSIALVLFLIGRREMAD